MHTHSRTHDVQCMHAHIHTPMHMHMHTRTHARTHAFARACRTGEGVWWNRTPIEGAPPRLFTAGVYNILTATQHASVQTLVMTQRLPVCVVCLPACVPACLSACLSACLRDCVTVSLAHAESRTWQVMVTPCTTSGGNNCNHAGSATTKTKRKSKKRANAKHAPPSALVTRSSETRCW